MGKFEIGNPGGPGRPKLTVEQKAVRKLSKDTVYALLDVVQSYSLKELQDLIQQENCPGAWVTTISAMLSDINKGRNDTLQDLWDRVLGKSKAKRQVKDVTPRDGEEEMYTVIYLPPNDRGPAPPGVEHEGTGD